MNNFFHTNQLTGGYFTGGGNPDNTQFIQTNTLTPSQNFNVEEVEEIQQPEVLNDTPGNENNSYMMIITIFVIVFILICIISIVVITYKSSTPTVITEYDRMSSLPSRMSTMSNM